jgi:hypothetical protein
MKESGIVLFQEVAQNQPVEVMVSRLQIICGEREIIRARARAALQAGAEIQPCLIA